MVQLCGFTTSHTSYTIAEPNKPGFFGHGTCKPKTVAGAIIVAPGVGMTTCIYCNTPVSDDCRVNLCANAQCAAVSCHACTKSALFDAMTTFSTQSASLACSACFQQVVPTTCEVLNTPSLLGALYSGPTCFWAAFSSLDEPPIHILEYLVTIYTTIIDARLHHTMCIGTLSKLRASRRRDHNLRAMLAEATLFP